MVIFLLSVLEMSYAVKSVTVKSQGNITSKLPKEKNKVKDILPQNYLKKKKKRRGNITSKLPQKINGIIE